MFTAKLVDQRYVTSEKEMNVTLQHKQTVSQLTLPLRLSPFESNEL